MFKAGDRVAYKPNGKDTFSNGECTVTVECVTEQAVWFSETQTKLSLASAQSSLYVVEPSVAPELLSLNVDVSAFGRIALISEVKGVIAQLESGYDSGGGFKSDGDTGYDFKISSALDEIEFTSVESVDTDASDENELPSFDGVSKLNFKCEFNSDDILTIMANVDRSISAVVNDTHCGKQSKTVCLSYEDTVKLRDFLIEKLDNSK